MAHSSERRRSPPEMPLLYWTFPHRMVRMRHRITAWLAALASVAAFAAEDPPLTALPYTPGLDVTAMDRSVDACVDFYQFSCGGWLRDNPIPADQAKWSVYGKLADDN